MRVRIPDDVVFEIIEDQAVVLSLSKGTYFALNESASRMWSLIEEHGDTDMVQKQMESEYDTDSDRIAADLKLFVDDLLSRDLLQSG